MRPALWAAILVGVGALWCAPTPSHAQELRVEGDTLIFDTDSVTDAEIDRADVEVILGLLRANPGITTLRLNSGGGQIYAARDIADIIIDFGLDTVVDGTCDSSCVIVFLGGTNRSMTLGSRLGFHARSWSAGDIASYYDTWRESEGWNSLFDFAAWLYQDTQAESAELLAYMVERGVDPGFAIESVRKRSFDMWRPRRVDLRAADVLTE